MIKIFSRNLMIDHTHPGKKAPSCLERNRLFNQLS